MAGRRASPRVWVRVSSGCGRHGGRAGARTPRIPSQICEHFQRYSYDYLKGPMFVISQDGNLSPMRMATMDADSHDSKATLDTPRPSPVLASYHFSWFMEFIMTCHNRLHSLGLYIFFTLGTDKASVATFLRGWSDALAGTPSRASESPRRPTYSVRHTWRRSGAPTAGAVSLWCTYNIWSTTTARGLA